MVGVMGGCAVGGYNGCGSVAVSTSAAAAANATTTAVSAAAPAAHVPAPWFPGLVKQMETRKNETTHNLIKSQEKVCRSTVATINGGGIKASCVEKQVYRSAALLAFGNSRQILAVGRRRCHNTGPTFFVSILIPRSITPRAPEKMSVLFRKGCSAL